MVSDLKLDGFRFLSFASAGCEKALDVTWILTEPPLLENLLPHFLFLLLLLLASNYQEVVLVFQVLYCCFSHVLLFFFSTLTNLFPHLSCCGHKLPFFPLVFLETKPWSDCGAAC